MNEHTHAHAIAVQTCIDLVNGLRKHTTERFTIDTLIRKYHPSIPDDVIDYICEVREPTYHAHEHWRLSFGYTGLLNARLSKLLKSENC